MASSEGRDENCAGTSLDAAAGSAGGHSVAELRSSSWDQALDSSAPSTSPPYWDSDDDDPGPRPSDLYGKFTWKIEKFSEISNRELRSNVFEVGGYKWYILVYPQGCDVCNHLSLFLCVSDYDKLLPGWSHFAQFTIAVVNKDPKKSKYSDTLHRFCKKEHDWGWKKFMELSKVLDGFIVADILVIKAQVQVIRENPNRPFRCLDSQYRRELVRVYLSNVEKICRLFVEEKREKLAKLIEETSRWSSFRAFWSAIDANVRQRLSREKTDVILKAIVKRFFNEKEVTSTLVMDALYSGCKALNYRSKNKKERANSSEGDNSFPVVLVEKDYFVLVDDVLSLLERAATEPLPPFKEDKGPQNRTKDCSGDDIAKDSVERDERRLTELGKRTIEIYVLAHLFSNRVEVAYREAIAFKRQEELIREEEAAGQAEIEFRAKREAAEREKKSKKKQAKQRRNNRKDKNRAKDEKASSVQVKVQQDLQSRKQSTERCSDECATAGIVNSTMGDDEDDLSGIDTTDIVVGTLGPAIEDGEAYRADWDRDGSETHQSMEAGFSGDVSAQPAQSGRAGRKHQVSIDDSSSTCSTDSLASVVVNGSYKGKASVPNQNQSLKRGKLKTSCERGDKVASMAETENFRQVTTADSNATPEASSSQAGLSADTVILSLKERVHWLEQRLAEKEEEVVMLQEKLSLQQHLMDDLKASIQLNDRVTDNSTKREPGTSGTSHADECKQAPSCTLADGLPTNTNRPCHAESAIANNVTPNQRSSLSKLSSGKHNTPMAHVLAKNENHRLAAHPVNAPEQCQASQKNAANSDVSSSTGSGQSSAPVPSGNDEVSGLSRPSSAPLIPAASKSSTPVISIQHAPALSRSVSASGRLGVGESAVTTSSSLSQSSPVTPSYKMAAVGKTRSPYNGQASIAVPNLNAQSPGTSSQCSNASNSTVTLQNQMIPVHSSSPTKPASPQQNHRMNVSNEFPTSQRKADASPPSSSVTSCVSTSLVPPPLSVPRKENASNTSHPERPVGFTFGSVTPEMLNRQRTCGYVEESSSRMDENSVKVNQNKQQHMFENYMHEPQGYHTHKFFQSQAQDSYDVRVHQPLNGSNIDGIHLHNYCPITDVRQASSVSSEEFPHIDIINDLLDDEQYRGVKSHSIIQHSGAQHSHRHPFPNFERLNSGHLLPDPNVLKGDRLEMSRLQEEGLFTVHSNSDPSNIALRESMHMVSPYAQSPYAHSYNQQGVMFDGIAHHWPMSSTDFSGGNINGNSYGTVNGHMAYPLHANPMSLGDCSNFSSGQTDYAIFSPRKDM
eukprot:TRINITY_DN1781_c0_g1_i1.p1 TRINITY_DN1781_c0_g1~~TRINITY_DN1781_c0_g1_i1.p1  ORF type:complete len:1298 (-),score=334.57 TRINITY_DN1781_c0_g1_i1:264-4157(-)